MPSPQAPWVVIARCAKESGGGKRASEPLPSLASHSHLSPPFSHHLADYAALAALAAIAILTEHAAPFIRPIYAGPDGKADEELWRYSYPLVARSSQRVPAWAVPTISFSIPLALLVLHRVLFGCSRLEFHASLLSLLSAIFAVGAATNTLKISVARPRPNFVARCWPHGGAPVFDAAGIAVCAPDAISPLEGRKSFPSGHTSWSAAGLGWASFWLAGRLRVWDRDAAGHPWRLCVAAAPIVLVVFIGVSRLQDSWHHPTDVMAGGALGLGLAYLFFRQTFHCFSGARAGEAYAGGGGGGGGEASEGGEGGALAGGGGPDALGV